MSDHLSIISRISRGADLDEVSAISQRRPITTNSIANPAFDPAIIQEDAEGTRIVVHERFPKLVQDFMAHKIEDGSEIEREFYSDPDWDWQAQVARLIAKRPLVFMNGTDYTVLRNGRNLGNAASLWDRVGKENQSSRLTLEEYLSYDEIMLGSLIGVSGPSYFINDGHRDNNGVVMGAGRFEPRGIIIGLVGARFERPDRMDSSYIQPPVAAPRQHPELDALFRAFFNNGTAPAPSVGFNVAMYKARMRITIDILLAEATARALEADKQAYVYIVGLGLGVWAVNQNQQRYFVETFLDALQANGALKGKGFWLDSLGTLDFSWINVPKELQRRVQQAAADMGCRAIFTNRNPAFKLAGEAARQLLVISYAWDGNSFPGNEYWQGALNASGDPAAACMSTIADLHNPVFNPGFLDRIYANGEQLEDE